MDIEIVENTSDLFSNESAAEQGSVEWHLSRLGKMTGSHFDGIMVGSEPESLTEKQTADFLKKLDNNDLSGLLQAFEDRNPSPAVLQKFVELPAALQKSLIGKLNKPEFNDSQITYFYSVAAEILTGEWEEVRMPRHVQEGKEREPFARQRLSDELMINIRDCGFFEIDEFIGSSPDGIIGSADMGVCELKCPTSRTHLKYLENPESLFEQYKYQCLGELWGTGLDWGIIASYDPRYKDRSKQIIWYEFTREKYSADMHALEKRVRSAESVIKKLIG